MLTQPRMLAILLLGAASGLPNPLSEAVMQAWLTDLGLSNTRIGLLMYVALPYLLKPLWAPLLDRYSLPWLGRRRGWIAFIQLLLAAAIGSLAAFGGAHQLTAIALVLLVRGVPVGVAGHRHRCVSHRCRAAGGTRPCRRRRQPRVSRVFLRRTRRCAHRRRQRQLARGLPDAGGRDGADDARDSLGTGAGRSARQVAADARGFGADTAARVVRRRPAWSRSSS